MTIGNMRKLAGLIESVELAYRMQGDMPGVMDLNKESDATRRLYGIGENITDDLGRKCLLARRMVEAGVRFVEINHGDWDHHFNLSQTLPANCAAIDRPLRGLLTNLKSRGLLKATLVIWGGEFGRTPHAEGQDGRDHHVKGFSLSCYAPKSPFHTKKFWRVLSGVRGEALQQQHPSPAVPIMNLGSGSAGLGMAGCGVKASTSFGVTDDYGYDVVDGKVSIHDWHATILHLLGLDHENLTYRHAGRDFRLTDVYGRVVREIVA